MQQLITPNLKKTYLAYFLLTITALFWSSNIVIGRYLHLELSPITLAFWRWFVASMLLLPFSIPYLRKDWKAIIGGWKMITLLSLLGISLFNTILYYSTQTTEATNIALIQTSMPMFVVIISFVLFSQKISLGMLIGLVLGISGATLVILKGDLLTLQSHNFSRGDISMLFAVFIYALYSVLLVKAPKIRLLSFLAMTFIIGVILLLPVYIWEQSTLPLFIPDLNLALLILYLAVFPSILAYLFWNYGVATIGSHTTGLFICFIPVFTPIIASIFLNESLYSYHYVAILLIILSVIVVHKTKI